MEKEKKIEEKTDLTILEDTVRRRYETLCELKKNISEIVSRLRGFPKEVDKDNTKREMGANRIKELTLMMETDFFDTITEIENMLTILNTVM